MNFKWANFHSNHNIVLLPVFITPSYYVKLLLLWYVLEISVLSLIFACGLLYQYYIISVNLPSSVRYIPPPEFSWFPLTFSLRCWFDIYWLLNWFRCFSTLSPHNICFLICFTDAKIKMQIGLILFLKSPGTRIVFIKTVTHIHSLLKRKQSSVSFLVRGVLCMNWKVRKYDHLMRRT